MLQLSFQITVLQEGIKLFRKQLPTIIHESVLNELKGMPEFHQPNNDRDTSGVVMWEKNDPPPIEVSQTSLGTKDPLPSSVVAKTPTNKKELVAKLRNYIISIGNDESMK